MIGLNRSKSLFRTINNEEDSKIEKNITEHFYSNDGGDARMLVYHIFPGVTVTYISAHMNEFDFSI